MIFYKLRFNSFPTVESAGTLATDGYREQISLGSGSLALMLYSGEIEWIDGEGTHIQSAYGISAVMPNTVVESRALTKETLYITSAQIRADIEFERIESDDKELCKSILRTSEDCLFLPYSQALGSEYVDIEKALRQVALYYPRETAASKLKAVSVFLDVLSRVDELFRESVLGDKNDSVLLYYSQKAKKYIKANYSRKVQIKEIAGELGISPNYLSNIFKQETGQTVSEYIAQVRLEKARELLRDKKMSIDVVAKRVGVGSARYLNEMFKKHYGSSIHKTMIIDRGVSLYCAQDSEKKD